MSIGCIGQPATPRAAGRIEAGQAGKPASTKTRRRWHAQAGANGGDGQPPDTDADHTMAHSPTPPLTTDAITGPKPNGPFDSKSGSAPGGMSRIRNGLRRDSSRPG